MRLSLFIFCINNEPFVDKHVSFHVIDRKTFFFKRGFEECKIKDLDREIGLYIYIGLNFEHTSQKHDIFREHKNILKNKLNLLEIVQKENSSITK